MPSSRIKKHIPVASGNRIPVPGAVPDDLGWIYPEGPYRKSLLFRLENPGQEARSIRCGFDYDPGRWHNRLHHYCPSDYELVYVLRGNAVHTDESGVLRSVGPGTLVQRIPGRRNTLYYPDEQERVVTCFLVLPAQMHALLARGGLCAPEPVIACGYHRAVIERLKLFYEQIRRCSEYDVPELLVQAHDTAVFLLRRLLHTPRALEGRAQYEQACRIMGQDLHLPLSLADAARRTGVSSRQLRALFTRHGAVSPVQYRISRRIEAAKEMLFGELALKEIASRLGYPDVYAFTRQFTRQTGIAPGRYRQMISCP